ncbi:alpha-galactosidase [Nocardioides sp.]|uniref:alpha-galactosidase n=1 Tax=Nocardioides sp. TaxID=35761 RepID=UPI002720438E|nr:alpha-galactosidase [Nocardioides sp.]MDO9456946.1 alpha-galactosidase [Nocardioides sp.]
MTHLTREGVSVVLAPSPSGVPVLLHWGAALGDLADDDVESLLALHTPATPHSALDAPRLRGVVGEAGSGFTGLPGLTGWRPGGASVAPRLRSWTWAPHDDPAVGVRVSSTDDEAGWAVDVDLGLTPEGLVLLRTTVTNVGTGALVLGQVRNALPVAARATELLDLTGRWTRERTPQRGPWRIGTHLREGRHGRTGHDASLLLAAGTPGFGFGHGEVWATHVAWSGDHAAYAERTPEGECLLGGGELLADGEVVLEPGASYASPALVGSYAADGLDGVSARFHAWLRRTRPLTRPRPVLVNTWEATYFDHDLAGLTALADAAAEVGAERFVLDDGWFLGRRDDRAGLGDWTVDPAVWPQGLHPLVDHVHQAGMDFGLWVEPEMVNVDSDLVRAHPDWVLRGRADLPDEWRHQQVLDLRVPAAYAHVRDALLALLDAYPIAFLKWDHNRDLVDVGAAVHGQTTAFYALLDELRATRPDLEIETCASGGGRVDLGVLARTDRVWASDTIDAVERQRIQRWTSLLVPPERLGAHVGGPVAHTTGRRHTLGFRAATALLGHLGIEWDVRGLDADQRAELGEWVRLHQRLRPLLATGRLVRGDHPDPAVVTTGIVAPDRAEAWYVVALVDSTLTQGPTPVTLPGLDPSRRYAVRDVTPAGHQAKGHIGASWLDGHGHVAAGSALGALGVRLPVLLPETARVLHVVADA